MTIQKEISPPTDNSWTELLRFYCQTADANDPGLPFMASMWSFAIANGELSGKHAASAELFVKHAMNKHGLGAHHE